MPHDVRRTAFVGCAVFIGSTAAVLLTGCTKTDTRTPRVRVSGAVLRMGQPVADATVIFEPVGATPAASGQTDAAGRFRLTTFDLNDGAAPGEYKVVLRKVQVITGERPAAATDDAGGPPPQEKWLLPMKYGQAASSGLTATVKPTAENNFKFDLPD